MRFYRGTCLCLRREREGATLRVEKEKENAEIELEEPLYDSDGQQNRSRSSKFDRLKTRNESDESESSDFRSADKKLTPGLQENWQLFLPMFQQFCK
ncbi:hypothetical protein U1Q18_021770 [Sarracenia purpurea var. burkii]